MPKVHLSQIYEPVLNQAGLYHSRSACCTYRTRSQLLSICLASFLMMEIQRWRRVPLWLWALSARVLTIQEWRCCFVNCPLTMEKTLISPSSSFGSLRFLFLATSFGNQFLTLLFAGFAAYGQGSHDSLLAIFRSVAFFSCLAGGNPRCFACMFGFQGHTPWKVPLPPVSSGAGNAAKDACYSWQVCTALFSWCMLSCWWNSSVLPGTLSPCQSQCGLGKLWMWLVKQAVQKLSLGLLHILLLFCLRTSRCDFLSLVKKSLMVGTYVKGCTTWQRAELATDQYIPLTSILEGFVILKENPNYKPDASKTPKKVLKLLF